LDRPVGQGRGSAGDKQPKRTRGETSRDRVAAQREGRRERAGLEGKDATLLLGWVEVA
jgi:hypothetical protein